MNVDKEWGIGNSFSLLLWLKTGVSTLEISVENPKETETRFTMWPIYTTSIPIYTKDLPSCSEITVHWFMLSMFIAAMIIIAI